MEFLQIIAVAIFLLTIVIILLNLIDRSLAAMLGVILMVLFGVISPNEIVKFVDWNIIGLLIGIWLIAGYFSKTGVPELIAAKTLKKSGGNPATFVILISFVAAIISMFVDNVVVVLMFAPVIIYACNKMKINPKIFILFTALMANLEGTALLIGDLPPMMLASISGIGFLDFFISEGRPAAFPILMLTTVGVLIVFWFYFKRKFLFNNLNQTKNFLEEEKFVKDKRFATVTCLVFIGTVILLAARDIIGLPFGLIGLSGAVFLAVVLRRGFDKVLGEIDWRAVFFYCFLFVLVGGLNKVGIIRMLADYLVGYVLTDVFVGISTIYWISAFLVAFIEHDAYILLMLHAIKTMSLLHGLNPFPFWWALVLAGTLGSNFTMVGAPALLVALNICEKEGCKISTTEFFKLTVPFTLISLVVCYFLTLCFWVIT